MNLDYPLPPPPPPPSPIPFNFLCFIFIVIDKCLLREVDRQTDRQSSRGVCFCLSDDNEDDDA